MKTRSDILNADFEYSTALIGTDLNIGDWLCDKWRCNIEGINVEFKTGLGLRKEGAPTAPELDDVLYCLLMDSEALNLSFAEWCDNLGYDANTDSRSELRRLEDTYDACRNSGYDAVEILKVCDDLTLEDARERFQNY